MSVLRSQNFLAAAAWKTVSGSQSPIISGAREEVHIGSLPPKALSVIKVTSRRGCTSRVRGAKLFKTYVGVSKFRMIAKTQKLDLNCVEWKCAYSRSPMVYNTALLSEYAR